MTSPIFTGVWGKKHIQGIAVDKNRGYIYYSFTTKLVKAKMNGEIVGSVEGLIGHLGCIAFNEADGYVYGSLEYKHDSIGKNILSAVNSEESFSDGFYIVRFDTSKINKTGLSAETDSIMTAVYLKEVVDDYMGTGANTRGEPVPHKYGCSGIDGLTLAPLPQSNDGKLYLYVAYGIYGDSTRSDNDHQVLVCYDPDIWEEYAAPLDQKNMHRQGPRHPYKKYFVYTGNTRYGVQNLEYDGFTDTILMAVYKGSKPEFPNYSLFAVDLTVPPVTNELTGLCEQGEVLSLKKTEQAGETEEAKKDHPKNSVFGWFFPYGSTGMYSYGDGSWLIARSAVEEGQQCGYIYPYTWDGVSPFTCLIPEKE